MLGLNSLLFKNADMNDFVGINITDSSGGVICLYMYEENFPTIINELARKYNEFKEK
jgi:hypothetical protein